LVEVNGDKPGSGAYWLLNYLEMMVFLRIFVFRLLDDVKCLNILDI